MFEHFITPINFPELIKMQANASVTYISPKEIKGLKAKEKAMLNKGNVTAGAKKFPKRYSK